MYYVMWQCLHAEAYGIQCLQSQHSYSEIFTFNLIHSFLSRISDKVKQSEVKWKRWNKVKQSKQSEAKGSKVKQSETKWNKMKQREAKWNKGSANWKKWSRVKKCNAEWNKVKQRETYNSVKTHEYKI